MKVRVCYTVDLGDDERRAINWHNYEQEGLASRDQIKESLEESALYWLSSVESAYLHDRESISFSVKHGAQEKERLILQMLINDGELYGLDMVKGSDGLLKRGTIYVILDRMHKKGYVEFRQDPRQNGMPRRKYMATERGSLLIRKSSVERCRKGGVG